MGGSPSPLWYTTRATGMLALLMLTASVVLGILATIRFATPRWSRVITSGLHRNVSLLVLVFLAIHILTAELDTFAPVGWLAVVIPFASAYRPLWLGLGTAASDLLVALAATSLLRTRMGYRSWRAVHWAAYACWPVALAHALGTGTDTRLRWVLLIDAACIAAVLGMLWWRLAAGWPANPAIRLTSAAVSLATPIALGAWLLAGPLAPGWAARAGTPAALLGHSSAAGAQGSPQASSPPGRPGDGAAPALPFTAKAAGSVTESQPDASGQVTVSIQVTTKGAAPTVLGIHLEGTPDGSGGVKMTASQVTWGPASDPRRYRGQITALDGDQIQAVVSGAGGTALALTANLRLAGNSASGTLHVTKPDQGDRQ